MFRRIRDFFFGRVSVDPVSKAHTERDEKSSAVEALEVETTEFITLEDGTDLPVWIRSRSLVSNSVGATAGPSIVVLFPYPLFPEDNGGSARVLFLLRELQKRGYVVWLAAVGLREEDRQRLGHYADVVVPIPDQPGDMETHIRESGLNTLRARYHPAFDEVAPILVEASSPRAVIACFAFSAYAFSRIPPGPLRIVDTIDVQHRRADIAQQHGGDLESRRCTRQDELESMRDADALISIQPDERALFEEMFPQKIHIVCGHAVSECRFLGAGESAREVLFIGNRYDPNTRGIQAFIREVWPGVLRNIPNATLEVVGTVCRDLSPDTPGVNLHGFVPDVEPFYERAAVVVNPVPYGSGQKIKTIEALAFGKCLVVTPAAQEGIPEGAPCVERELGAMADPLIELLKNPIKRQGMEQEALEFAKVNFRPEQVFRNFFDVLEGHGST